MRAAVDMDGRILTDPRGLTQACLLMVAGREKKNREQFEQAFLECQRQNPLAERVSIDDAKHGDFSLAAYYRVKDKKGVDALVQNKSITDLLVAFLNRN